MQNYERSENVRHSFGVSLLALFLGTFLIWTSDIFPSLSCAHVLLNWSAMGSAGDPYYCLITQPQTLLGLHNFRTFLDFLGNLKYKNQDIGMPNSTKPRRADSNNHFGNCFSIITNFYHWCSLSTNESLEMEKQPKCSCRNQAPDPYK